MVATDRFFFLREPIAPSHLMVIAEIPVMNAFRNIQPSEKLISQG